MVGMILLAYLAYSLGFPTTAILALVCGLINGVITGIKIGHEIGKS